MSRANLSSNDKEARDRSNYWEVRQALYIHPGNYTSESVLMADGSVRYIAVPPVINTLYLTNDTQNGNRKANQFQVYRNDEFFIRFDAAAETQHSAYVPANMLQTWNLNPGVQTISIAAVTNTGKVRMNFLWGD